MKLFKFFSTVFTFLTIVFIFAFSVLAFETPGAFVDCGPGFRWNGTTCASLTTCALGERWDGQKCVPAEAETGGELIPRGQGPQTPPLGSGEAEPERNLFPSLPGSGSVQSGQSGSRISLPNPLAANDITELVDRIATWLLTIGIALSTLAIIWSALQFMVSGGNEKRVEAARKTIWYAIIGIVVLLLAKGITLIIAGFLGGGGGSGGYLQVLPPERCPAFCQGKPCTNDNGLYVCR